MTSKPGPAPRRGSNANAKTKPAPPSRKAADEKADPPRKEKKLKVVRDSFTMPRGDYDKLAELKKRALKASVSVKKSELLRAGLHVLSRLTEEALLQEIGQLESVKTGRPAKHELARKAKSGKSKR